MLQSTRFNIDLANLTWRSKQDLFTKPFLHGQNILPTYDYINKDTATISRRHRLRRKETIHTQRKDRKIPALHKRNPQYRFQANTNGRHSTNRRPMGYKRTRNQTRLLSHLRSRTVGD